MQTVDMSKEFDRLNASDQHFVRKLEQMNFTRAKDMKVMRSRNKLTGLLIGTGVLGVCILVYEALFCVYLAAVECC